jgi:serine/threonine protein phosphatase PrpC
MHWPWHNSRKPTCELETSLVSDIGRVRTTNEDAGQIIRPADSSVFDKKGVLMLVADGMGGCEGGEIASQRAVEIVGRSYYADRADTSVALVNAFEEANAAIYRLSLGRPDLKGMGTTCTALVLREDLAWVAYVGDTRLYLIRNGEIYRMVEDHSAVMELVKQGLVRREDARHHEDRNVILRALGTHEQIAVSTWSEPLPVRAGDQFVLCSDGLYDLVEDDEIREVARSRTPAAACAALVAMARERGGHDNITVAVAHVATLQTARPQLARETRALEVTR